MPLPPIPSNPTPDQIVQFVSDAGESISSTIADSAKSSQQALTDGVNTAVTQLQAIADEARQGLDRSSDRARRDLLDLLGQIRRLGGALQEDLALGTVNGEPFFEPVGCFVLVTKAVSAGSRTIVFQTREPSVVSAFQGLVSSNADELRAKAMEKLALKFPHLRDLAIQRAVGVDDATYILALATLVLAVGVSLFIVCVGLALLYAISRNYDINEISMEWDGGGPKLKIGSIKR